MTTMNHEAVKARRLGSDYCGDDLPRAGSIRDRVRFGSPTRYPRRPATLAPVDRNRDRGYFGVCIEVTWVADQLLAYVAHAEQGDFAHKTDGQRMDVLNAIRSLKARLCKAGGADAHEALLARCLAMSKSMAN